MKFGNTNSMSVIYRCLFPLSNGATVFDGSVLIMYENVLVLKNLNMMGYQVNNSQ